jgi:hypothetical protein
MGVAIAIPGWAAAAGSGGHTTAITIKVRARSARMGCKRRQSMSDPLLRELDHYVVLEPGGAEAILTSAETLAWLQTHLRQLGAPPADLAGLADPGERAQRLLDTACELELEPGRVVSWFAVRLEPPGEVS